MAAQSLETTGRPRDIHPDVIISPPQLESDGLHVTFDGGGESFRLLGV